MNKFNDNRIENMERFIKNLKMFLNGRYRFDQAYDYAIQIEQNKSKNKRTIEDDFFSDIFNDDFFNMENYEMYFYEVENETKEEVEYVGTKFSDYVPWQERWEEYTDRYR